MGKNKDYTYKVIPLCNGFTFILDGREMKNILNIGRREFNKYIKPYGKIDIDKIKEIGIEEEKLNKWLRYDGWLIEEYNI